MDYYLNISQGVSVVYGSYDRSLSNFNSGHFQLDETVDGKAKGVYTQKSKGRFSSIIKNWLSVLESVNLLEHNGRRSINRDLRFVTLTLPSKQFHDDKFVRRHMLNRFISEIKRKDKVINYVYCSETQKNGNIHFHIVIDKYINHKSIRGTWNTILSTNGYIDIFEKKHGHRNPNSTDIHSLNKVHSIAAYLIKYFTKDEKRRKIEGRLWGASDNLRKLDHYSTFVSFEESQMFENMRKANKVKYYSKDYFTIYSGMCFHDFKQYSEVIYNDLIQFYGKQKDILSGLAEPTVNETIVSNGEIQILTKTNQTDQMPTNIKKSKPKKTNQAIKKTKHTTIESVQQSFLSSTEFSKPIKKNKPNHYE